MSKQEWGNSTWFLFHGLATKIKPEYPEEYKKLLSLFIKTCNHLPCPDCKMHAVETNNSANLNKINSNAALKDYLWQFHNRVNKRLNKPFFSMEQHNSMYRTVKINMLTQPFYSALTARVPSALMMEAFHRKRHVNEVIKYIKNNYYKFDN
jgi:hypothetical protein